MQPLDVSINKTLTTAYNKAIENWQLSHPLEKVTIYHVGALVGTAYRAAFTHKNITSTFRATGIHPFNDAVFTEEDVLEYFTELYKDNPDNIPLIDVPLPVTQSATPVTASSSSYTPPAENQVKTNEEVDTELMLTPPTRSVTPDLEPMLTSPIRPKTPNLELTLTPRQITPTELFGFPIVESVKKRATEPEPETKKEDQRRKVGL